MILVRRRLSYEIGERDFRLRGEYQTAVVSETDENNVPPPSQIYGTFRDTHDGVLVAFNVQRRFTSRLRVDDSVASWSGKLFRSSPAQFGTTWILVKNNEHEDVWSNVVTNRDVFTRV